MTTADMRQWVLDHGLPAFRASQIGHGLFRQLSPTLAELSDLPQVLRQELAREASFVLAEVEREVSDAPSRTTKTLFKLVDGALVESVLMGYEGLDSHRRHTVCLSSQVGCALGCSFCATGLMGWARDLSAAEMVEQVLYYARLLREFDERVTNIVYMGMGEPFLNFDAMWQSVKVLTDPAGFNLGARHITLSTSGVVPGILRLAEEESQVGLAVSLHSADDDLRTRLVPLNKRYPVREVIAACRHYIARTHRRVSFEYTLLAGVNDGEEQAYSLARLLRGMICHVNVIPWNRVEGMPYQPSSPEAIAAFRDCLVSQGIASTVRDTRGSRISAACGQLRTASERRPAAMPKA
jgi:23S rRNA (adenine2503-C2)-methyltransferase